MKKKVLLILFCFMVALSPELMAQSEAPKTSTAANPVWYYVKVKGSIATRQDRLFSVSGNDVYGGYMKDVTSSNRNYYLWRFEEDGDSYKIISKRSNRVLSIKTDADKKTDILTTITSRADTTGLSWSVIAHATKKGYFQIKSSTGKFATQSSSSLEYVIQAAASGITDNSLFHFILCDDTPPTASTNDNEVWYYINSAQTGNTDKCITDINASANDAVKFELLPKGTNKDENYNQQWKIVKPTTASSVMHFVNRETGNVINTAYDYNSYFNAQSTSDIEESNGWRLTFINLTQFKISGLDANGITGYLNASSTLSPAEEIPTTEEFFDSAFAWTFELVDKPNSIDEIPVTNPLENVNFRVEDRRIIVEGTDNYSVYHISGFKVSKDIQLPVGVYLLNINGKTISILVK
ncbi:hypothetical protein M2138_001598 [Dysgonomonadaceae bacterium PH5-43]|nr:hypothetical protein [Dysgonomonadaceae bacterium PH5-43]